VPAGTCKRCGEPTGNPDGRQWYCSQCRPIKPNRPPKPCYGCGGPKELGRKFYCDTCTANGVPQARDAERNRRNARRYARERRRPNRCVRCECEIPNLGRPGRWICDPCRIARDAEARAAAQAQRDAFADPEVVAWRAIIRNDPCAYCGAPFEEIDHIVPHRLGGNDSWTNLIAACFRCNRHKRARPLLSFLLAQCA